MADSGDPEENSRLWSFRETLETVKESLYKSSDSPETTAEMSFAGMAELKRELEMEMEQELEKRGTCKEAWAVGVSLSLLYTNTLRMQARRHAKMAQARGS